MMRVPHRDPRKQAETDGLQREREGPRDQRLRRDDGGNGCKHDHRDQERVGNETVEELAPGDGRRTQQVGALTEIIEQQGGINHPEPAGANRTLPEVPQVRIHRLSARDHEHQRAQNQQRRVEVRVAQEDDRVPRVEGGANLRVQADLVDAEQRDRHEPDDQDGTEYTTDARCAPGLNGEQEGEQHRGERNDGMTQRGRRDTDAFHGREHADGRRDHPVAEQQSRADHQRPQQHAESAALMLVQKAVKREHAAFAVVLGAQHENRIFDRNDDRQCPNDQRDAAEHIAGRSRHAAVRKEDLIDGVKRGGADVAIDDPDGTQGQRGETARGRMHRPARNRRRLAVNVTGRLHVFRSGILG